MRVTRETCGAMKDSAFMLRTVRGNQERHICRAHAVKMRRVHGGRMIAVKRAG